MDSKGENDLISAFGNIRPIADRHFKNELYLRISSLHEIKTEPIFSISGLRERLVNMFSNVSFSRSLSLAGIILVVQTLLLVGVYALPTLYTLLDCSKGQGKCWELLGGNDSNGAQSKLGVSTEGLPLEQKEAWDELNAINVFSTSNYRDEFVRSILQHPVIFDEEGIKVHLENPEVFPKSLPQIYVESSGLILVANILSPTQTKEELDRAVREVVTRIKSGDFRNPLGSYNWGDVNLDSNEKFITVLEGLPEDKKFVVNGHIFYDTAIGQNSSENQPFNTYYSITSKNELVSFTVEKLEMTDLIKRLGELFEEVNSSK